MKQDIKKINKHFFYGKNKLETQKMLSVRVNVDLMDLVKDDSKKHKMKLGEYINNLFLVKFIMQKKGKDIMNVLKD